MIKSSDWETSSGCTQERAVPTMMAQCHLLVCRFWAEGWSLQTACAGDPPWGGTSASISWLISKLFKFWTSFKSAKRLWETESHVWKSTTVYICFLLTYFILWGFLAHIQCISNILISPASLLQLLPDIPPWPPLHFTSSFHLFKSEMIYMHFTYIMRIVTMYNLVYKVAGYECLSLISLFIWPMKTTKGRLYHLQGIAFSFI